MLEAEVTPARLAELAQVDEKSVRRWLTGERLPYPIHRHRVAVALCVEETYLWPQLLTAERGGPGHGRIIDEVFPTRTAISSGTWHGLFSRATRQIDVLVYVGAFLIEALDLPEVLRYKAEHGTKVRLLVGDPDSAAVQARAEELSLPWLPERCRTTAEFFSKEGASAACVRSHGTTLYASLFRFDDTMLINTHAHGVWSAHSPVLRLERDSSPVFEFYVQAFERVFVIARDLVQMEGQQDHDWRR